MAFQRIKDIFSAAFLLFKRLLSPTTANSEEVEAKLKKEIEAENGAGILSRGLRNFIVWFSIAYSITFINLMFILLLKTLFGS